MRENRIVLDILFATVVGYAIGRRRAYRVHRTHRGSVFQHRGEALLARAVKADFGPPDFHLMNHITLRMKDGTTEIDHILVSRFGVFVIEVKHYQGWIFANAKHDNWTQVLFRKKCKFQNPIHQNSRHARAVRATLDFLPADAIKSVVVFTGDAEFKTEMPPGVFSLSAFVEYLREKTVEVMSINRLQFCVGRLETARLAITRETDVEHARSLERRHSVGSGFA
ncbi:MAG TPA: NERD domain-containing protein [Deltaproteobacteria bacterium]|nr:NERD domain-containing protein [Deltaproteobacteria bacterium]